MKTGYSAASFRISRRIPLTRSAVRKWLILDLKQRGYNFREIGQLFGLTRQRVCQIEHRLSRARENIIAKTHLVTPRQFNDLLDNLNRRYERQLQRIVRNRDRRPKFYWSIVKSGGETTLFWKVWPCVESYRFEPFTLSKLISDYPMLEPETLLRQFLARLRKQGLLKKIGEQRNEHHRLEMVMIEVPIEEYVAPLVEKLVERWSDELLRFGERYSPGRPIENVAALRQWLIGVLAVRGMSPQEIERTFPLIPDNL